MISKFIHDIANPLTTLSLVCMNEINEMKNINILISEIREIQLQIREQKPLDIIIVIQNLYNKFKMININNEVTKEIEHIFNVYQYLFKIKKTLVYTEYNHEINVLICLQQIACAYKPLFSVNNQILYIDNSIVNTFVKIINEYEKCEKIGYKVDKSMYKIKT